jgi:hypothetical protein
MPIVEVDIDDRYFSRYSNIGEITWQVIQKNLQPSSTTPDLKWSEYIKHQPL